MNDVMVAFGNSFLESLLRLPLKTQNRVHEFLIKFRQNPMSKAINYEKVVNSKLAPKVWSVRIDDTYRAIVLREEGSGVFVLVWVDHHDEAYEWASRKRFNINPYTGIIQLYTVQEIVETVVVRSLFADISDNELLQIGVPQDQIKFTRSFTRKEDFLQSKDDFSPDVYIGLSWLLDGTPVQEVIEVLQEDRKSSAGTPADLRSALNTPENRHYFYVVEGEDELKAILDKPLEKWRVFLHPTQRKIVTMDYSGPAVVTGTAGTGKTVVAMHRAKWLASQSTEKGRILLTSYLSRMVNDLKENLREICSNEELDKITVETLDTCVLRIGRIFSYPFQLSHHIKEWEMAIQEADASDLKLSIDFYQHEWEHVVLPLNAQNDVAKYMNSPNNSWNSHLKLQQRKQVWTVFDKYRQIMDKARKRDFRWAMAELGPLLNKESKAFYSHIIVDEVQDFDPTAMKFIRSIAGKEHPNDIFLVGDSHQRIYRRTSILSECGIHVQERRMNLRINYRTSEENRAYASKFLEGISFDNLDGQQILNDKCHSLTHGNAPVVKHFQSAEDEINYITGQIHGLIQNGTLLKDICILIASYAGNEYGKELTKRGLKCFSITDARRDDRNEDGIRVLSMSSVKGLEFQYVFVAGVNQDKVPWEDIYEIPYPEVKREAITRARCLVYVALTRAQKGVYISSYGKKSEFFSL